MNRSVYSRRSIRLAAALTGAAIALAACGGTSTPGPSAAGGPTSSSGKASAGGKVLPVSSNPISNTATAPTLKIDSVLVENNVDARGKATDDHLEVTVSNTGSTPTSGLEFFYTFADPKAKIEESYYAKLADSVVIPAGGKQVVNFDSSGRAGAVPVNEFSLYATSKNALKVTVVASASGAAVSTATVQKDAGGAEAAD